jgi:hypothetical protein
MALDPQTSAAATNVPRRPIFLRDKDSGFRWISVDKG